MSIYGCGTTDGGAQKFKVSLWKKVDGGAQYVDNTTFYFTADGQNYHCDIDNLDPNASYRVTISYDSSRYYLYGLMKVEASAEMNTQTKHSLMLMLCAFIWGHGVRGPERRLRHGGLFFFGRAQLAGGAGAAAHRPCL